jgi:hypothetical protein
MIDASGRDIRLQVDGGVTAANIKEIAEVICILYIHIYICVYIYMYIYYIYIHIIYMYV